MAKKKLLLDFLFTYKMSLLLISLLGQLIVPAFFAGGEHYTLVTHLTVSITVLISILIFKNSRNSILFITVTSLAFLALLLNGFDLITNYTETFKLPRIFAIMFMYIFIFSYIFNEFKFKEEVTLDFIFGAVSGYIIIGFFSAFLCFLMHYHTPGAIAFKTVMPLYHDFVYYAFITMTTVGYGDIVATTPLAQTLAVTIALMGQLYLAITIAIIVGRYLTENQYRKHNK